jgi:hypothetical protein
LLVNGDGADHRLDQGRPSSLGHELRLPGGQASSCAFNQGLQLRSCWSPQGRRDAKVGEGQVGDGAAQLVQHRRGSVLVAAYERGGALCVVDV